MDSIGKLQELSSQMELEHEGERDCALLAMRNPSRANINVSHAIMPNGKRLALLKTHLTSACERDCLYCAFRSGRDSRRTALPPSEMAKAFNALHAAGIVEGMFLSSGIAGGSIHTQDRIIETADLLRHKYGFQGYLHLKIMPGAQYAQVERSMQLADRISINLEAPNEIRLSLLAPRKKFDTELLQTIRWASEIRSKNPHRLAFKNRWSSITTQYVVGAVGENDVELLQTTDYLHNRFNLARAYFSTFTPVRDTPLENKPPGSLIRQRRLYQASFLLRDYGYDLEDLPFEGNGNLPLGQDPKLAWANGHLRDQPIEINKAERKDLLRVPGIGPKTVQVILSARKTGLIRQVADLRNLGVNVERALPFILVNGRSSVAQLSLWAGFQV